jgi:hypothetical protein
MRNVQEWRKLIKKTATCETAILTIVQEIGRLGSAIGTGSAPASETNEMLEYVSHRSITPVLHHSITPISPHSTLHS